MVRTNQGGSILNFIIVGVVLAALLIGGGYVIHQKTQVSGDTTPAPAPAPASAPEQDTSKKKDDSKKTESKSETPAASKPSTTPATPEKQPAAEQPAPTSPSASQLPQTGPAETFSSVLALGLLGYVTTAYLRSRRARALALTSLL